MFNDSSLLLVAHIGLVFINRELSRIVDSDSKIEFAINRTSVRPDRTGPFIAGPDLILRVHNLDFEEIVLKFVEQIDPKINLKCYFRKVFY